MITELKNIIKRVEKWPKKRQEDATRALLEMEQNPLPRRTLLTKEQIKEVESVQRGIRAGKIKMLSDKQVKAMWKSFGL